MGSMGSMGHSSIPRVVSLLPGLLVATVAARTMLAGCAHDDQPPPPEDQVHDMAVSDLACDGTIEVDQVSDTDYCAYGCGRSHRYVCSPSDECSGTWPDLC